MAERKERNLKLNHNFLKASPVWKKKMPTTLRVDHRQAECSLKMKKSLQAPTMSLVRIIIRDMNLVSIASYADHRKDYLENCPGLEHVSSGYELISHRLHL
jgi:hypothetical protein